VTETLAVCGPQAMLSATHPPAPESAGVPLATSEVPPPPSMEVATEAMAASSPPLPPAPLEAPVPAMAPPRPEPDLVSAALEAAAGALQFDSSINQDEAGPANSLTAGVGTSSAAAAAPGNTQPVQQGVVAFDQQYSEVITPEQLLQGFGTGRPDGARGAQQQHLQQVVDAQPDGGRQQEQQGQQEQVRQQQGPAGAVQKPVQTRLDSALESSILSQSSSLLASMLTQALGR
jgi:hypothetical protein